MDKTHYKELIEKYFEETITDGVTIFSEVVRTNKSDEHLLVC